MPTLRWHSSFRIYPPRFHSHSRIAGPNPQREPPFSLNRRRHYNKRNLHSLPRILIIRLLFFAIFQVEEQDAHAGSRVSNPHEKVRNREVLRAADGEASPGETAATVKIAA
ncbi:hypothetical protein G7Z17_g9869 [Cylindrodendrum hubeiense]|uniref:Uncharacterized protein n=1 Tax=Cylindrodendrum hubeiense TaxID=595255 RepID=A0A9P5LBS8_9HYPO|nr:hypothetical protein G7Z17_g9869 [Cylindrodendrum hubeiense]